MGFRGETTNGKVDGGAGRVEIDPRARDAADAATPKAPPTRRTLTFPTSDVLRVPSARRREDAAGARSLFTAEAPEATLLRAVGGYESSGDLGAPRDALAERPSERSAGDALAERPSERLAGDALAERPSERSTVPTLASNGVVSDSSASLLELSASELESVRDLATLARAPFAAPPLPKLDLAAPPHGLETARDDLTAPRDGLDASRAITERPPPDDAPPSRRRRRAAIGLAVSHAVVAAVVALVAVSGRSSSQSTIVREPNVALSERTPLASPAAASRPAPPSGGCATSGGARVLAPRAQIGPGLDVTVLETGFGVALASGTREAVGLRVEGSGLRIAETVRVKSPSLVSHAVVESGGDDDSEALDVRVDEGEVRTVAGGGDGPGFRIVARGGAITALLDDLRGARARTLWALPGASFARTPSAAARGPSAPSASPARGASAPSASPARGPSAPSASPARGPSAPVASPARGPSPSTPAAPAVKSSPYLPTGVARPAAAPRAPARAVAYAAPEVVRAAARDDGGAVVALRRPSTFYLGVADGSLAPAGPLVPLVRKGATVGAPAVAPWGGGGAVAWAERAAGERDWSIVVAGFTPDGEGATTLGPVRVIGAGMSPSLAALPDGDLLLAFADGLAGAHRVVAIRLGRDLEPRGEPLVVSPDAINAGQPALAVRPDGRAIVAFFAADRGRAASVFATPLACDPGF